MSVNDLTPALTPNCRCLHNFAPIGRARQTETGARQVTEGNGGTMSENRARVAPNTRFGYYMLQTRTRRDDSERTVQMTLEDLATGEKHVFGSNAEFGKFLDEWRTQK